MIFMYLKKKNTFVEEKDEEASERVDSYQEIFRMIKPTKTPAPVPIAEPAAPYDPTFVASTPRYGWIKIYAASNATTALKICSMICETDV